MAGRPLVSHSGGESDTKSGSGCRDDDEARIPPACLEGEFFQPSHHRSSASVPSTHGSINLSALLSIRGVGAHLLRCSTRGSPRIIEKRGGSLVGSSNGEEIESHHLFEVIILSFLSPPNRYPPYPAILREGPPTPIARRRQF